MISSEIWEKNTFLFLIFYLIWFTPQTELEYSD